MSKQWMEVRLVETSGERRKFILGKYQTEFREVAEKRARAKFSRMFNRFETGGWEVDVRVTSSPELDEKAAKRKRITRADLVVADIFAEAT